MSGFAAEAAIAEIGAALGDAGRVRMLAALMAGRALTAGELAWQARVTPQTASGHLARLTAAGLVDVIPQGRHRYYRIPSSEVAEMIEAVTVLAAAAPVPRYRPTSARDAALRAARTCYDHLAGQLGVMLADSLVTSGRLVWSAEGGVLTPAGARQLTDLGIDIDAVSARRRHFCRPCLDWSERRWHIGGAVGAGLATRLTELGWIKQDPDSRAVSVTREGAEGFSRVFGLSLADFVAEEAV